MKSFAKTHVGEEARVELHDSLALTGAEVSINTLPAGACVPFVHSHKNNQICMHPDQGRFSGRLHCNGCSD